MRCTNLAETYAVMVIWMFWLNRWCDRIIKQMINNFATVVLNLIDCMNQLSSKVLKQDILLIRSN